MKKQWQLVSGFPHTLQRKRIVHGSSKTAVLIPPQGSSSGKMGSQDSEKVSKESNQTKIFLHFGKHSPAQLER